MRHPFLLRREESSARDLQSSRLDRAFPFRLQLRLPLHHEVEEQRLYSPGKLSRGRQLLRSCLCQVEQVDSLQLLLAARVAGSRARRISMNGVSLPSANLGHSPMLIFWPRGFRHRSRHRKKSHAFDRHPLALDLPGMTGCAGLAEILHQHESPRRSGLWQSAREVGAFLSLCEVLPQMAGVIEKDPGARAVGIASEIGMAVLEAGKLDGVTALALRVGELFEVDWRP